jgi:ATP-dependent Clp protease ATP-binding subunit ClpC
MCDVCGIRPAVGTIQLIRPGQPPETLRLCKIHLAEQRAMSSGFGGLGMFDDFFSRFFSEPVGVSGGGGGSTGGRPGGSREVEQTDITQLFSDATRDLLQRAAQTAAEWGSIDLDTDHLLHGALSDEVVVHVLEQAGADPKAIAAQIENEVDQGKPVDVSPSLTPDAKRAILTSYEEARELAASYIGPEHILLALARDEDTQAGEILRRFGLTHTALRGQVVRGVDREGQPTVASTTKTLDQYSRDLTALAREGKLDPVIGRADEIEQTVEILSRRTKNNPVLIGDPGVGKTAIVEGIAQRIVNDEVPETLAERRLVALDLSGMIAGTKYRGEFEERLKSVIDEFLNRIDEIIVFRSLTREQVVDITRLLLDRVTRRLHAQRIELRFDDEAVGHLADAGFDPEFGARPLQRTIQRLIENQLSRMLLDGPLQEGDAVTVRLKDGRLDFDVTRKVGESDEVAVATAGSTPA